MKYVLIALCFIVMASCLSNRNYADHWYNKGYKQHARRHYQKSIQFLNKAVALNPRDKEAFNLRGCAKDELNDYKGAIGDFDKALFLDSLYADAYYNKGNAEFDSGNYINAMACYQRALEIEPADQDCNDMLEQTYSILFSEMHDE